MEKQRSIKVLSVVALIVAILGLTVAFAALSSTLTINGTASVGGDTDTSGKKTWSVKFDTVTGVTASKTGSASAEAPTLSETSLNFDVVLSKPGDSVTASFKILNDGKTDAKIGSLIKGNVEEDGSVTTFGCSPVSGGSATQEEANAICDDIKYTFTYDSVDGTEVKTNDVIRAGDSKTVFVHVEYENTEATQTLPSDDLAINGLGITINFVQN